MNKNEIDYTLFFPVYKDEKTVEKVTLKALNFLNELNCNFEIIIVNDGSPDESGSIADRLSKEHPSVRVIHHPANMGYGAAIRSGLNAAKGDWIMFTDGDDEYDIFDFRKLVKHKEYYDLIITFRYIRMYSSWRQLISIVYNGFFRYLFNTTYRDISTGLRMIRRAVFLDIDLQSSSPFIGAEITVKSMLKGYRVGEVGIQTFPREFGKGSSVALKNIIATIKDMYRIHGSIFNANYDLPAHRDRIKPNRQVKDV